MCNLSDAHNRPRVVQEVDPCFDQARRAVPSDESYLTIFGVPFNTSEELKGTEIMTGKSLTAQQQVATIITYVRNGVHVVDVGASLLLLPGM